MVPAFITAADWNTIWAATTSLAQFTWLQIAGALIFLIGHAVIPSLAFTHQLSPRVALIRPAFYVVAFVAFALAWFSLGQAVVNLIAVIGHIYPRWAI